MNFSIPVCHKQPLTNNSEGRSLELADIFRLHADDYLANHKLSLKQHKVIFNIKHCRDGEFGYHIDICNKCDYTEKGNNSCRDRHCPKCQGSKRRKWVQARVRELLPVPYYHTVFTLPHFLFILSLYNKTLIYNLLFDCAAQTLLQFGRDPKHLGATIGFYGILHTWGGKLWQHLHVHFIVAGGGLNEAGQWVEPKHKGKFLFPVCAMSKVFRGKFVEGLKNAYYRNELKLPDELAHLSIPGNFEQWIDTLVGRDWVVYAKAPMATPEKALANLSNYANKEVTSDNRLISLDGIAENNGMVEEKRPSGSFSEKVVGYIGRYTNQTAICNDQLLSMDQGQIRFKFKNYKNKGCWEETTLPATEFIRRFLMHVLPDGFHRIRYFGLFANGKRQANIEKIRQQLPMSETEVPLEQEAGTACPICHDGILIPILEVTPFGTFILKPSWLYNKGDPGGTGSGCPN